jgi:hypothetical protein
MLGRARQSIYWHAYILQLTRDVIHRARILHLLPLHLPPNPAQSSFANPKLTQNISESTFGKQVTLLQLALNVHALVSGHSTRNMTCQVSQMAPRAMEVPVGEGGILHSA